MILRLKFAAVALGAFLLVPAVAPSANAQPLGKEAQGCQGAVAKGLQGFKKAKLKAWASCLNGILKGTGCDTAKRDATIATAITKANATVAKKCTSNVIAFGAPPAGVGFAQTCQLEAPPLEPYETGCSNLPVTNVSQLTACLICWKEGELYEFLKILYPCLQGTVPAGSDLDCGTPPGSCPDPATQKDAVVCLQTISKAGRGWLLAKEKAMEKCLVGIAKGKIVGNCPDAKTQAKLGAAAQKAKDKIGACRVFPQWWDVCPEGEPCGAPITTLPGIGNCVVDAAGQIVDELLCMQFPLHPGVTCPVGEGTTTTTTTLPNPCCDSLPSLLSFTTGTSGCGVNPPGSVEPARCVQGTNNGTACTSDGNCTGGGVCRGHLDCTALYFGSGQPSGIGLPGVIPDRGLYYSKIASCSSDTLDLTPTTSGEVPGPGCPTQAGTPTYGERHCTSPGCLYGAPLALPNPAATATGTCVHNVIANGPGVGTGTVTCSTGAYNSLNLPLQSKIYLTGAIEPVRTCSICAGGTPGVCASGTCMGTSGARDGLPCTPETSALNGSYPTSHDCPAPNAPAGGGTCGVNSGTFIGCLPIAYNLSTGTQTLTSFATGAQARVFCGFCFDPNVSSAFANPPDPCTSDAECAARGDDFDSCRQHNNGAFRNTFATTITETGSPAGTSIATGLPYPTTVVSVFCIPPSYDPIVDPSGELPGPGAVSLPGEAQLIP